MEDSGDELDKLRQTTAGSAGGGDIREDMIKDELERLSQLVQLQPISDKQYRVKYDELK